MFQQTAGRAAPSGDSPTGRLHLRTEGAFTRVLTRGVGAASGHRSKSLNLTLKLTVR